MDEKLGCIRAAVLETYEPKTPGFYRSFAQVVFILATENSGSWQEQLHYLEIAIANFGILCELDDTDANPSEQLQLLHTSQQMKIAEMLCRLALKHNLPFDSRYSGYTLAA